MEIIWLTLFIAGAIGALVKDILKDNQIELPKKLDGKFSLGFLGGTIVGGVVGIIIDGSPVTAFLAGYAGTSAIENLLIKPIVGKNANMAKIKEIIRAVGKTEGVDPDLAIRVAKCESNLDPVAIHTNSDGSRDRGLFQINDKFHPKVTDEQAFNTVLATRFFCKAFKAGKLSWWNATKDCWKK